MEFDERVPFVPHNLLEAKKWRSEKQQEEEKRKA
jgi:hypothetical protein